LINRDRDIIGLPPNVNYILKSDWFSYPLAMGNVLNHFSMDVFRELYCSLRPTRGAHPSALAGEGDEKRVFASIAIHPGGAVSEDSAVKIFVEGLQYLIP
jgi:hypothetical protein